ncbi:glycosyltransferase family 39 protein [Desulfovibrio sp. TomC]|uniref:glycosyltransferase family 39 protein n=1 Tax=Desulfovibrio sp. TomC TaxID=1562888 RepID=UPI0005732957|nr:glycosyltransferase family 39 protein [Desulfovibrio sp. TomC]KHK02545.1 hypothetical protein NY78_1902 [Desulfovibrio sp. TomC]
MGVTPNGREAGGGRKQLALAFWMLCVLAGLGVCAYLLSAGWGRWGDLQIDFGREVYIPWQLAQGRVLYRDLTYSYGPLSPYVQAGLFRLFGASLSVVLVSNAGLLLATTLAVWKLVRTQSDSRTALVAVWTFVLLCGLNQVLSLGNYNFITPYSHALTYGLCLALFALALFGRFLARRTMGAAFGAGFLTGTAMLTKPEICLALGLALALGWGMLLRQDWPRRGRGGACLGVFAAGWALPLVLAFAALVTVLSPAQVFAAFYEPWSMMFDPSINGNTFYVTVFGGGNLLASLQAMGWSLAANGVVCLYVLCLGVLARRIGGAGSLLGPAAAMAGVAVVFWHLSLPEQAELFFRLPQAWPLLLAALTLWLLAGQWSAGTGQGGTGLMSLVLVGFAAALVLKIACNANLYHYGALLLAPGCLVLVVCLLRVLPAVCGAKATAPRSVFAAGATFVCLFSLIAVQLSVLAFARKTEVVTTARGSMAWDARGALVREALSQLEHLAGPEDTLAVLPEGAMLNFLTGRANPNRYVNLVLWDYMAGLSQNILAIYEAAPPDWIVFMQRDTTEFGYDFFCRGYGQDLCRWIGQEYEEVAVFGARPLVDNRFGLLLLRRKPSGG